MKKIPISIILFFTSIITINLSSCINDKSTENEQRRKANFVLTDSIILSIDTSTSTESGTLLFYSDQNLNKDYIVYYDNITRKITFIDLKTQKVDFKINIHNKGKNAISYYAGFCIKNLDSIYVFSAGLKIYRINRYGEILSTIDYDTLVSDFPIVPLSSFSKFHTNAIIVKNEMYVIQGDATYHYSDINDPTKYNFCYKVNLNKNTVNLMKIHHPDNYWAKGVKELLVSWDYNGSSFVYSPLYSNDIYLSKNNNKIDKIYKIKSRYINSLNFYNPNNIPSQEEYLENRLLYQRYLGIIYDPYNDCYYRFFWSGMDITNFSDEELVKNYKNIPTFGISVINKNFQIVDEIILPEYTYTPHKYFITEKGLAISADHPDNPSLTESKWIFHIYNLKTIK